MSHLIFMGGDECEGADLVLEHGVTLQLAREPNGSWGVWAVSVAGVIYRQPCDLSAEALRQGDFREWIEERYDEYVAARRKARAA